ncbi:flagellar assembly factor FliW [Gemmatimonadetes bacterium T265]|nr:flagellar assembly factor FliW [Gemmatimonadetes bacterium T265]
MIMSTLAPPAPAEIVTSDLLGPIAAAPAAWFTFPAGLYGFESCRSFVLVPAGRPALHWLQSVEESGLVFLLAEPGHFFPDDELDVPAPDLDALAGAGAAADDFAAFAIVTLGERRGDATINLQAPLVLHVPSRAGRQIVRDDGRARVRVPLAIG